MLDNRGDEGRGVDVLWESRVAPSNAVVGPGEMPSPITRSFNGHALAESRRGQLGEVGELPQRVSEAVPMVAELRIQSTMEQQSLSQGS